MKFKNVLSKLILMASPCAAVKLMQMQATCWKNICATSAHTNEHFYFPGQNKCFTLADVQCGPIIAYWTKIGWYFFCGKKDRNYDAIKGRKWYK